MPEKHTVTTQQWYVLHQTIAFAFNAIAIGFIIYFVIRTDSDKSGIIFMIFYPALTVLNLIIAIILGFLKAAQAKIYKQIAITQILLFVPLVIVMSQF